MKSARFSRGRVWAVAILTAVPLLPRAQVLYRGDANQDYQVDSADVIAVYNTLLNLSGVPGLQRLLADTNGDGTVDEMDVVNTSDIVLGKARALPLVEKQHAPAVSVLYVENPPAVRSENTTQGSTASFYFVPPVPGTTEGNTVQVATASLYFVPPLPPITEQNTAPNDAVSFYRVPPSPLATEDNTVEVGNPSFYYQPAAPQANGSDAVQQGTPSFDRQ